MARHVVGVPTTDQPGEMTILGWHVESGQMVSEGDDLVSVETDKVDLVIPSPTDGSLIEVLANPGDAVSAGDPICVIESS